MRDCHFNGFIKRRILKIWRDTFGWRRFFMLDWWRCLHQLRRPFRFGGYSNSYTVLMKHYKGVKYKPAWQWIDPVKEKAADRVMFRHGLKGEDIEKAKANE